MDQKQSKLDVPVVISDWLRSLLVDPLSKKRFICQDESGFQSPCGFQYHYKDGVPDFRVRFTDGDNEWQQGQSAYESQLDKYFDQGEADDDFYKREQAIDGPIYETLKLKGRVLDVGGQLGHIRKYMQHNQEYCSLDPFVGVHLRASNRRNLFESYPLSNPINFVGGYAEFLPFQDNSFDVINMRSCIDHFFNPKIALLEAFRVLKSGKGGGGELIIGLTLNSRSWKSTIKDFVRPVVSVFLTRYRDHHIWHPTYENLIKLCDECGFDLQEKVWQTPDVLYASFIRRTLHTI